MDPVQCHIAVFVPNASNVILKPLFLKYTVSNKYLYSSLGQQVTSHGYLPHKTRFMGVSHTSGVSYTWLPRFLSAMRWSRRHNRATTAFSVRYELRMKKKLASSVQTNTAKPDDTTPTGEINHRFPLLMLRRTKKPWSSAWILRRSFPLQNM